jgi:hypothetical protein
MSPGLRHWSDCRHSAHAVSPGGVRSCYTEDGKLTSRLDFYSDFKERFADLGEPGNREFSNVREGLIVGLLSIGALAAR